MYIQVAPEVHWAQGNRPTDMSQRAPDGDALMTPLDTTGGPLVGGLKVYSIDGLGDTLDHGARPPGASQNHDPRLKHTQAASHLQLHEAQQQPRFLGQLAALDKEQQRDHDNPGARLENDRSLLAQAV